LVNGEKTVLVLGAYGSEWLWQNAGKVTISNKNTTIALHDLTGFNGRVDAIYFTKDNTPPPGEVEALAKFRKKQPGVPQKPEKYPEFEIRNIISSGEIWTGKGENTRNLFPRASGCMKTN
jgi:hypothetical protein